MFLRCKESKNKENSCRILNAVAMEQFTLSITVTSEADKLKMLFDTEERRKSLKGRK
jgi:hypothetical protein